MIINITDVLTLSDNNEYVVVSKTNYDSIEYYYLIDKNNDANVKFCYLDNDELVELDDKELTTKLIPFFVKEMDKILN